MQSEQNRKKGQLISSISWVTASESHCCDGIDSENAHVSIQTAAHPKRDPQMRHSVNDSIRATLERTPQFKRFKDKLNRAHFLKRAHDFKVALCLKEKSEADLAAEWRCHSKRLAR